ncbi:RNA recognition motif domain-containing protein [Candidatus Contubernalis alkaliaceticus]|uniref:RNA recognition motif domain-containing protein n=1 Tax=Candidatus Contubernalis alkaliaceticus TaxID=338645 RepID=UPI001F4C37D4|nr:RNA-binding protein [Candidatus Contubernalis alkalaceticus]UNC93327.1 RNA-binding protein [Candidatus Contubernalis alkalaceticus]
MTKTLYVGNIPWALDENELLTVFSEHGDIVNCRIITDRRTGRSKGYGFVEVDEESADKIIEAMNGTGLNGREIIVNEAKAREEH